jgi:hypothetical protein
MPGNSLSSPNGREAAREVVREVTRLFLRKLPGQVRIGLAVAVLTRQSAPTVAAYGGRVGRRGAGIAAPIRPYPDVDVIPVKPARPQWSPPRA